MICSIMLFVVPVVYSAEKLRTLEEMYVVTRSVEFVDSVRNTGRITKDMYETYLRQLDTLSCRYTADMTQVIYNITGDGMSRMEYDREDIENELYNKERDYGMRREDYFKVCVVSENARNTKIVCIYGGYVRNEAYGYSIAFCDDYGYISNTI